MERLGKPRSPKKSYCLCQGQGVKDTRTTRTQGQGVGHGQGVKSHFDLSLQAEIV